MSKTIKEYRFTLDPVEDQDLVEYIENTSDGEFEKDEQLFIRDLLDRGLQHFFDECDSEEKTTSTPLSTEKSFAERKQEKDQARLSKPQAPDAKFRIEPSTEKPSVEEKYAITDVMYSFGEGDTIRAGQVKKLIVNGEEKDLPVTVTFPCTVELPKDATPPSSLPEEKKEEAAAFNIVRLTARPTIDNVKQALDYLRGYRLPADLIAELEDAFYRVIDPMKVDTVPSLTTGGTLTTAFSLGEAAGQLAGMAVAGLMKAAEYGASGKAGDKKNNDKKENEIMAISNRDVIKQVAKVDGVDLTSEELDALEIQLADAMVPPKRSWESILVDRIVDAAKAIQAGKAAAKKEGQ